MHYAVCEYSSNIIVARRPFVVGSVGGNGAINHQFSITSETCKKTKTNKVYSLALLKYAHIRTMYRVYNDLHAISIDTDTLVGQQTVTSAIIIIRCVVKHTIPSLSFSQPFVFRTSYSSQFIWYICTYSYILLHSTTYAIGRTHRSVMITKNLQYVSTTDSII